MSYETEFMKEFEEWIKTQVMINEMALEESKKVFDEDQDEDVYKRQTTNQAVRGSTPLGCMVVRLCKNRIRKSTLSSTG